MSIRAARLGQPFEACGDIDPITKNVAVLDDDVADIDTDPEFYAVIFCSNRTEQSSV
jgi:hypothetical protein